MKCGCHPNCGIGAALMISKTTKEWAPLTKFLAADQLLADAKFIADAGRGPAMTKVLAALSLLRNYRPFEAPKGLSLPALIKKFDKQTGGALGGRIGAPNNGDRKSDEWLLMFVAGMWFQDLWTYDFRRTEMCIIPYATQMGEISFCAYNTGVGWRQIVEKMYQNATVAEWYKAHGKHGVYANPRQHVPLSNQPPPSLRIPDDTTLIPLRSLRQTAVSSRRLETSPRARAGSRAQRGSVVRSHRQLERVVRVNRSVAAPRRSMRRPCLT